MFYRCIRATQLILVLQFQLILGSLFSVKFNMRSGAHQDLMSGVYLDGLGIWIGVVLGFVLGLL